MLSHPQAICWEVAFKGKEVSKPLEQWLVLSCLLGVFFFLHLGLRFFGH